MHQSHINIRYAKSLFLLAEEKNQLNSVKQDIHTILQWFEENEDVNVLLEHPLIKASKKVEILTKLFKNKVTEYTLSFLSLIVKNKRENHIKSICNNFISIYKEFNSIQNCNIFKIFLLSRLSTITSILEHFGFF